MKSLAVVLLIALSMVTACKDAGRDEELAAVRSQVAQREQQLRVEKGRSRALQEIADMRLEQVRTEKARADELEARMARIRDILETIEANQRSRNVLSASVATTNTPREESLSEWQRLEKGQREQRETRSVTYDITITAPCSAKWGSDHKMVLYCQEKQQEAKNRLDRGNTYGISGMGFDTIRRDCAVKWGDDYSMRVYCEEKQAEAYKIVNRQ